MPIGRREHCILSGTSGCGVDGKDAAAHAGDIAGARPHAHWRCSGDFDHRTRRRPLRWTGRRIAARAGEWRVLPADLVLLIAGSSGAGLTAARAIESAGYLLVIVSAPVLMVREARPLTPELALVVWSTFLPVGPALGKTLSGALVVPLGSRTVLVLWSLTGVALALGKPRGGSVAGVPAFRSGIRPAGTALVLAAGFGCFTCFHVGMLALMPEFRILEKGANPRTAGLVTGLGGFTTISGVMVHFYLPRRSAVRLPLPLLILSLVVPAALLFGAFSPAASLGSSAILFIGLNV